MGFLERQGFVQMGMAARPSEEPAVPSRSSKDSVPQEHMLVTPPSMERLLIPTKCWAQKIGVNTGPDVREQRQYMFGDVGSQPVTVVQQLPRSPVLAASPVPIGVMPVSPYMTRPFA